MQDQALFSRNALERLSEQIGPALRARRATDYGTRFWLRAAKRRIEAAGSRGTGESSDRLPPLASDGSRLSAARPAKAGLEEPIVGLSSRGASSANAAAPQRLAPKQARRQMPPQWIEMVQFAPGNGMAPADLDPQHLVLARAATVAPKGPRRPSPRAAASRRKLHDLVPKTLKSLARLSTLHVWLDEMETPRRRVIAGMATRFADNDDVLQGVGLAVTKLQILAPNPLKRKACLQTVRTPAMAGA